MNGGEGLACTTLSSIKDVHKGHPQFFCLLSTLPPPRTSANKRYILVSKNVNRFHIYVVCYILKTSNYHIWNNFIICVETNKTKHYFEIYFWEIQPKFLKHYILQTSAFVSWPPPPLRPLLTNHPPPQVRTSFMHAPLVTFKSVFFISHNIIENVQNSTFESLNRFSN